MSWDLFIQNIPADAQSIGDIPDEFEPAPLGSRATIIEKIHEVAPFADFSDPFWGIIDGVGFSIEVNLGVRAIDTSTAEFFKPADALASLRMWRAYRDHIVGSSEEAPK